MRVNKLFLCVMMSFFSYVSVSYSMMNREPSIWEKLHAGASPTVSMFKESFLSKSFLNEMTAVNPSSLFHGQSDQPLKDQLTISLVKGPILSVFPIEF